ncbi:hypothetical protein JCM10207_007068 [Rhodosporidiobolus poonsookiae]
MALSLELALPRAVASASPPMLFPPPLPAALPTSPPSYSAVTDVSSSHGTEIVDTALSPALAGQAGLIGGDAVWAGKARRGWDEGGDDSSFGRGDYGWGTDITTETVTLDATSFEPYTTIYTVYEGADTTFTLGPDVVTYTLYPTATHYETSVITEHELTYLTLTSTHTATLEAPTTTTTALPESTVTVSESTSETSETLPTTPPPWLTLTTPTSSSSSTRTSTSTEASASATSPSSARSRCQPGDEDEKEPGLFEPTGEQKTTLYVVGITVAWNLWGLRVLLYGFKSFTVLIHEAGHALGLLLTGQPLYRFTIDPNAGGATYTTPGRVLRPPSLFLGQLFSILFGGVMVFVGFNTLASKYASFVIMPLWLAVMAFQINLFSGLVCAASLGLLVGIWFIEHAAGLRYFMLFLGIMSSFYILWDTMDDFFHRKQNECCVVVHEANTGIPAMGESSLPLSSRTKPDLLFLAVWLGVWFFLSMAMLVGFILGALAYWRETEHGMYCQGQSFAPT